MRSLRFTVVTLVALIGAGNAQQETESQRQAVEWQTLQLERSETALVEALSQAEAAMPASAYEALVSQQPQWRASRDQTAELFASTANGSGERNSSWTATYLMVQARLTNWRAEIIGGLGSYHEDPGSYRWEGLWIDGDGGQLAIREGPGGSLEFRLSANRGPNYHTGLLKGTATAVGDRAIFDTTYNTNRGAEPVSVRFSREGPYVHVSTTNAQHFHGDDAYFDASYVRVRDLRPYDLE